MDIGADNCFDNQTDRQISLRTENEGESYKMNLINEKMRGFISCDN